MSALFRTQLRACRSFLLTPGSRPKRFGPALAAGVVPMVELPRAVFVGDLMANAYERVAGRSSAAVTLPPILVRESIVND
jgi:hypothetical protein